MNNDTILLPTDQDLEVEVKVKITNKPILRAAKYEDLNQVLHVRIKLWKIQYCNLKNLNVNTDLLTGLDQENQKNMRAQLYRFLALPTLKKTFKNIRKISLYGEKIILKFFSKTWKLQDLRISFSYTQFPIKQFMKYNVNPKLKTFSMQYWQGPEILPLLPNKYLIESLYYLTSLKECAISLPSENKDQIVPCKLYKFRRLAKLTLGDEGSYCFLVPSSLKQLKNLETLTLPTSSAGEFQHILSEFGAFQNLRVLNIHFRGTSQSTGENSLSFLINCKRLESLSLFVERLKDYSLDCLLHLENLKELCFQEIGTVLKKNENLKKFPKLQTLNKFTLFLRNTTYCLKSIRELLLENRNLKELSLDISLPELVELSRDDLKLPIEALTLQLPKVKVNIEHLVPDLTHFITTHHQLRKLSFKTQMTEAEVSRMMFNTLRKLTLLEELEFIVPLVNEQKEFSDGKSDLLISLVNLETLVLDVKRVKISSLEFKSLGEHLFKFKKLKKFVLETNLDQISADEYEKFIKLARIAKQKKNLQMTLHGYSSSEHYYNRKMNSASSIWRIHYQYE